MDCRGPDRGTSGPADRLCPISLPLSPPGTDGRRMSPGGRHPLRARTRPFLAGMPGRTCSGRITPTTTCGSWSIAPAMPPGRWSTSWPNNPASMAYPRAGADRAAGHEQPQDRGHVAGHVAGRCLARDRGLAGFRHDTSCRLAAGIGRAASRSAGGGLVGKPLVYAGRADGRFAGPLPLERGRGGPDVLVRNRLGRIAGDQSDVLAPVRSAAAPGQRLRRRQHHLPLRSGLWIPDCLLARRC